MTSCRDPGSLDDLLMVALVQVDLASRRIGSGHPAARNVEEIRSAVNAARELTGQLFSPRPARPPSAQAVTARATILLVKESDLVWRLATDVLEQNGYRVLAAASDHEAVAMLRELSSAIDLLLVDGLSTSMSGHQLVSRVRAQRPGLRVLFVSTSAALAGRETPEPGVAFLEKPFTPDGLLGKIGEILP